LSSLRTHDFWFVWLPPALLLLYLSLQRSCWLPVNEGPDKTAAINVAAKQS
jgi:hypothetical protein